MTPEQRRQLRIGRLNQKGQGVANELAEMMASKDIRLGDIGPSGVPMRDKKERRLREFLEMINAARKIICGDGYLEKVAAEEQRRQLYLDDNPWFEAAGDHGDRRETDDTEQR